MGVPGNAGLMSPKAYGRLHSRTRSTVDSLLADDDAGYLSPLEDTFSILSDDAQPPQATYVQVGLPKKILAVPGPTSIIGRHVLRVQVCSDASWRWWCKRAGAWGFQPCWNWILLKGIFAIRQPCCPA